jgi:lysophospholipase I
VEDEEGLYRAVNWINKLISIEETEHNIPPERIIIGGLSQGGAVSLLTTITIKKPLAGLFALSTYIPLRRKTLEVYSCYPFFIIKHIINFFPKILTPFAKQIPIFWGHGKEDLQVDYEFSIKTAETLASNLEVPFQSYENIALTRKELEKNPPEGLRFHSYGNLRHWVNEQELMDLYAWILFLLPDVNSTWKKLERLNFLKWLYNFRK